MARVVGVVWHVPFSLCGRKRRMFSSPLHLRDGAIRRTTKSFCPVSPRVGRHSGMEKSEEKTWLRDEDCIVGRGLL